MAGCATRTNFAGHPGYSAAAGHALTFNLDHPMGAHTFHMADNRGSQTPFRGSRSWSPHDGNASSKALACFKSSVSKPSVNQP
jgi:hypothetical protein